jgi:hypothetical protein
MHIHIDSEGNILSTGCGNGWLGLPPSAPLPDDFQQTYALGKYKGRVVGDTVEVYAVPGWVPPPAGAPPPPPAGGV